MTKKVVNILFFIGFALTCLYMVNKSSWAMEGVRRVEKRFVKESTKKPASTFSDESLDSLAAEKDKKDSLTIVEAQP